MGGERERGREREHMSVVSFFGFQVFGGRMCSCNVVSLWSYVCFLYSCIVSVTEGYQYIIGDFSISVYYILLMSYVEMEGEKYFFEGQEQKKFLLHSFIHSFIHNSFILATRGVPGTLLILYKTIF